MLVLSCFGINSQTNKAVVLNMTAYNAETNNSRFLSAYRIMQSAGLSFDTTSSLSTALNYPVVLVGSRILQTSFSNTERIQLVNYVLNGGVLIHSAVRDTQLFTLCGISASNSEDTLYSISFNSTLNTDLFRLVDDSLEQTISLGNRQSGPTFFSRYYDITSAQVLGTYQDGTSAFVYNNYGSGHVYTFGPDLRDIYYRGQLNFDINAQRTYSNGFEPSADVIMFIIRNAVAKHISNSVYKHSAPLNYSSCVLITHDVDSHTALDTMDVFATYEQAKGISAQYNITVRYFGDAWMQDFYTGSYTKIHNLISQGHILASHSVGHFPDFADDAIVPFGNFGNNMTNYNPSYNSGLTSNATVMGELEVSKNALEQDHNVVIKSFRAGHLAFPDSLIYGMHLLNYKYNSTNSSNDVLTNFPYTEPYIHSFSSTLSKVLEIPMTISDVFASDPITDTNYLQKVDVWNNVTRKYDANNSPTTLLIHPNRHYKLDAMQRYVDSLPAKCLVYGFEAYGEYWNKRDSLRFNSAVSGDSLKIMFTNNISVPFQSFIVDTTGINAVVFYNSTNTQLQFTSEVYQGNLKLYYPSGVIVGINKHNTHATVNLFPNPTNDIMYISSSEGFKDGFVQVFDLSGKILKTVNIPRPCNYFKIHTSELNAGIYFISVEGKYYKFIKN